MAGPATIEDLRTRYAGDIPADREDYAGTLLEDAYDVILEEIPSVATRIDQTGSTLLNSVIRVQCSMVARVLRNPNAYLTETVDDYTYRFDSAVSAGRLYLADDERSTLADGRARRGAFSIKPS